MVTALLEEIRGLMKAAPGPPPRPGLEWKEETHRWVCFVEGCETRHGDHGEDEDGGREVKRTDKAGTRRAELVAVMSEVDPVKRHYAFNDIMPKIKAQLAEGFIPEDVSSYVDARQHLALYDGSGFGYIEMGHTAINATLRGEREGSPRTQEKIEEILQLARPLGVNQVLYRGLPDAMRAADGNVVKEGSVVMFNSFISTSRSPERPLFSFMGRWTSTPKMATFIEIDASKDAVGITLSNGTTHTPEDETILFPNQGFVIELVEEIRPGVMYVRGSVGYETGRSVQKAPPGPPPRPGLEWRERTRRWVCPAEGCEALHPEGHGEGEVPSSSKLGRSESADAIMLSAAMEESLAALPREDQEKLRALMEEQARREGGVTDLGLQQVWLKYWMGKEWTPHASLKVPPGLFKFLTQMMPGASDGQVEQAFSVVLDTLDAEGRVTAMEVAQAAQQALAKKEGGEEVEQAPPGEGEIVQAPAGGRYSEGLHTFQAWDRVRQQGKLEDGSRRYDPMRNEWVLKYLNWGYLGLNEKLRAGEALGGQERSITEALYSQMRPAKQEGVVYRGLDQALKIAEGEVGPGVRVPIDAFMSTSRDPMVAAAFTGHTFLELRVDLGWQQLQLSDVVQGRPERETILSPGAQEVVIERVLTGVPVWDEEREQHVPTQYVVGRVRRTQGELELSKAPPGPPPRPGLEWREETHRWVCPAEGCEERA